MNGESRCCFVKAFSMVTFNSWLYCEERVRGGAVGEGTTSQKVALSIPDKIYYNFSLT